MFTILNLNNFYQLINEHFKTMKKKEKATKHCCAYYKLPVIWHTVSIQFRALFVSGNPKIASVRHWAVSDIENNITLISSHRRNSSFSSRFQLKFICLVVNNNNNVFNWKPWHKYKRISSN